MQLAPFNTVNNITKAAYAPNFGAKKQKQNPALEMGKTLAGSVAVGAASGGLVSLIPFPNTEIVEAKLADKILSIAKENDTVPNNAKTLWEQFARAKEYLAASEEYRQINIKELLLKYQLKLSQAFSDEDIKSTLSEISENIESLKDVAPNGSLTSGALDAAKTTVLTEITKLINKNPQNVGDVAKSAALENIEKAQNSFLDSIKNYVKNADADDTFLGAIRKEANNINRKNLMGKAITFAVAIALITKLFELLQAKKEPKPNVQTPIPNVQPNLQANIQPNMQFDVQPVVQNTAISPLYMQSGPANIWNMMQAQGKQNTNKFIIMG